MIYVFFIILADVKLGDSRDKANRTRFHYGRATTFIHGHYLEWLVKYDNYGLEKVGWHLNIYMLCQLIFVMKYTTVYSNIVMFANENTKYQDGIVGFVFIALLHYCGHIRPWWPHQTMVAISNHGGHIKPWWPYQTTGVN